MTRRGAAALLGATLLGCAPPASAGPMRVGMWGLEAERVAGADRVTAANAGPMSRVTLLVTVGVDGGVIDARVADGGDRVDPAPALAAVRGWRFRPQRFDGVPVEVVGTVTVDVSPPARPVDAAAPFPHGRPADVEVTLERSACFGSCPAYVVSIRGDGTVRFGNDRTGLNGTDAAVHRQFNDASVLIAGPATARVDPAAVAALLARFEAAHFFGLQGAYRAPVTDSPTQVLTVSIGGRTKEVVDYVGLEAGMPPVVRDLEEAVDRLAGTDRWVNGNATTLAWLEGRRFDFRSAAAGELAARATLFARRQKPAATAALLNGLLDRGLRLDLPVATQARAPAATVGGVMFWWAALTGQEALGTRLSVAGAARQADRAALQTAFDQGAGCSPATARMLVRLGVDPRHTSEGTALTAIRQSWGPCHEAGDTALAAMADALIDLGVPLEARDSSGWTALMGVNAPALARTLLARGAKVNARTSDGDTPVLTTDDDRVALILLRAGADPRAGNRNGSVRARAAKSPMPVTLAWLDAHGVR